MGAGGDRIGSVAFLNARPLAEGLGEIVLDTPAGLADRMRAGELDAALVPVVELFEHPEYVAVDGVGIVAEREVRSVLLVQDRPWYQMKRVALDQASRTSAMLLRVILEQHKGIRPEYVADGADADARLIIGDRALDWRRENPEVRALDLGVAWHTYHRRPFVFAVWAIRRGAADPSALAQRLRAAKAAGAARRGKYAKDDFELDYLTNVLSYDVGKVERESVAYFQNLLFDGGYLRERVELEWI